MSWWYPKDLPTFDPLKVNITISEGFRPYDAYVVSYCIEDATGHEELQSFVAGSTNDNYELYVECIDQKEHKHTIRIALHAYNRTDHVSSCLSEYVYLTFDHINWFSMEED